MGLTQSDYITINRVETSSSGHGSGAESSSLTSRDQPLGGAITTNERSVSEAPSQEKIISEVKGNEGGTSTGTSDVQNHITGSVAENANPVPSRGHVTRDLSSVKDADRGGVAVAPMAGTMATSELQLPAKQSLAVLSNVRDAAILSFITFCRNFIEP